MPIAFSVKVIVRWAHILLVLSLPSCSSLYLNLLYLQLSSNSQFLLLLFNSYWCSLLTSCSFWPSVPTLATCLISKYVLIKPSHMLGLIIALNSNFTSFLEDVKSSSNIVQSVAFFAPWELVTVKPAIIASNISITIVRGSGLVLEDAIIGIFSSSSTPWLFIFLLLWPLSWFISLFLLSNSSMDIPSLLSSSL